MSHLSLRADIPARDQCLQNPDLLEEILAHISSESSGKDLKAERRTLMFVALTCRSMSPSATKFLWRRLDNLLPLLRLFPTFTVRDGVYGLFGPLTTESFDRHAAFVKELIYEEIPGHHTMIDPSVYLRLCLRASMVLPNLERLVCTAAQPSAAEILVCMKSPLRTLQLGSFDVRMDDATSIITRDMVVSSLSANESHVATLILFNQPLRLLSEGILVESLTSLEFRSMDGFMDEQTLRLMGSLPRLHSLTTDTSCFVGLLPCPVAPNSNGPLFMQLTHLKLEGNVSGDPAHRALFGSILGFIASNHLQSLMLRYSHRLTRISQAGRGRGRGRGGLLSGNGEIHKDPLHIIVRRWSESLRHLELDIGSDSTAFVQLLGSLSALRSLKLSGLLPVPHVVDFCSVFVGLAELETLALHSWGPGARPISLDMRSIARLAVLCPNLRELHTPFSSSSLSTPIDIPTMPHNLRTITVHRCDLITDTVTLARQLDRLFPRLNTLRYETPAALFGEGKSEFETAWAQVQELVFAFQDVRREALARVGFQ